MNERRRDMSTTNKIYYSFSEFFFDNFRLFYTQKCAVSAHEHWNLFSCCLLFLNKWTIISNSQVCANLLIKYLRDGNILWVRSKWRILWGWRGLDVTGVEHWFPQHDWLVCNTELATLIANFSMKLSVNSSLSTRLERLVAPRSASENFSIYLFSYFNFNGNKK